MTAQFRSDALMKLLISFILVASILLSSVSPAFAAEGEPQPAPQLTSENIEAFLDSFFAAPEVEPHYVGASVAVVKGDEVIASKGYGYANLEEERAVDPANTLFRIASVSKTFTAVAIMQLVEQGLIDLQADIQTYLPGIEIKNPFDVPVTVEHLLTHMTGFEIRDPAQEDLHTDFEKYVAIEDYVIENMPPVVRMPGSSYMYDNFASLLLGLIVQNVSEQPYEEYMEEHIFAPLNMDKSGFVLTEAVLNDLATGYDPANQPVQPYTFTPTIMPHGGMVSTADDLAKFMVALFNTEQLFSEASYQAMVEYRSFIHPLMPNTTYGFEAASQIPGAGSSTDIVTKLGDLPGNSSILLLIPDQEVGVFLTYNKQGILRDLFYQQFLMTFFPEYAMPAQLDLAEVSSAAELEKLSGLYSDLRLRILISSISVADDGVLIISDALIGPRTLQQVDDYLFQDDLTGQFTAFTIDEETGVIYMKEPYLNPLSYAQKGQEPAGFNDVASDHPYAQYIFSLQSLGYLPNEEGQAFEPEREVTRAEMVKHLLESSLLKGSKSTDYGFTDIEGHPLADYIQAAYEIGMIHGDGKGQFAPDRAATRQEVAVMIWNLLRLQYPDELFEQVNLAGDVADWAAPAVRMLTALGLHGPEVQLTAEGAVDFQAARTMKHQEAAALLYQLMTQPIEQMLLQLQAQMMEEAEALEPAVPETAASEERQESAEAIDQDDNDSLESDADQSDVDETEEADPSVELDDASEIEEAA